MITPAPLKVRLANVAKPNLVAVTDTHHSLSYEQLIERVESLGQWLVANRVSTLALHAENSIAWVIVDLACQETGTLCIPLPSFFSDEQLDSCLKDTLVDMLMTDSAQLIESVISREPDANELFDAPCPIRTLKLNPEACHQDLSSDQQRCPSNTQKITFTSGSTGTPKGVCLSTDHQWMTADALVVTIAIESPRHLCVLPLATLLENVAGIYAPLLSGGTIIVPSDTQRGLSGSSGLDLGALLECISSVSPTTMILLPALLSALVAACQQGWAPPETLKFIAVGGAKVAPELLSQALELGLPVYEGYGLSECGSVVALNTPSDNQHATVGKVLPHCNVSIVGEDIVVSKSVFHGYYGDRDSWYQASVNTGDLGSLENGYLAVNGRRKNLIISSFGRNINPEWVESELLGKPLLLQCVVVGENRPNLAAFISAPENISNQQINSWITYVNRRLPDYARVKRWQRLEVKQWDGLLTANGRPQRQKLNQQFEQKIEELYSRNNFDEPNFGNLKNHIQQVDHDADSPNETELMRSS